METVMTLFGRSFTQYGLGCAAALLVGILVTGVCACRRGVPYARLIRTACLSVPLVLLFSRLVYVLANCTYYLTTLSRVDLALCFWDGGYSLTGALLGFFLAVLLAGGKSCRSRLFDGMAVAMPAAVLVERLFEAGTGMGLGRAIQTQALRELAFCCAEDLSGSSVHAVYRYEAVLAAVWLVVAVVLFCRRRHEGQLLAVMLTLLSCSQILMESLRDDGHMVVHFVRIQQVLYAVFAAAAMGWFTRQGIRQGLHGYWWKHLLMIACVGLCIFQEFRIDRSENIWLDYGIMAVALAVMVAAVLLCRCRKEMPHGASGN